MKVLGITGGTGCGKTTLLARVAARGGFTVDCDEVYHRLLRDDASLLAAIGARFPGVVRGGELERRKLGKVVFGDPAALEALNALVHPAVVRETARLLDGARRAGIALAAIDAVALVESGLGALCGVTVAVTAPVEARVRRLTAREDVTEDYARLRIAAQKKGEDFAAQCDRVLCNDYPDAACFAEACDRFLDEAIAACPETMEVI